MKQTTENKVKTLELTTKHKIRLLFGIHGLMEGYGYLFNCIPEKLINKMPEKFRRWWWNVLMYKYLSPLLNKIFGYTPGDWRK